MKGKLLGVAAASLMAAANIAAADSPSPGFYNTEQNLLANQGTTCPASSTIGAGFTHMVVTPTQLTTYNAPQANGLVTTVFTINAQNGTMISGNDTQTLREGGTGTPLTASGPFSFTVTVFDSNSFLFDGTYTVFAPLANVTCVQRILGVAIKTGPSEQLQPQFAGAPGLPTCRSVSVAALINKYGSLSAAATALGLQDTSSLQNSISQFCQS
jgi:hypothetical protein